MLALVFNCCVMAFASWLLCNIAINIGAVRFAFLEPQAPDNRGETSHLRIRVGPESIRAKHVLLAEKSLRIIAGFLVGLYPVEVTQVRVDEYRVVPRLGLTRFIKALLYGGERKRVAPKLTVRLAGVSVTLKGNGSDAWRQQREAVETAIESMNHTQANQLTDILDKAVAGGRSDAPAPPARPSALSRLIDGIVNAVEIEVEGLHFSLASKDHDDAASCRAVAAAPSPHEDPSVRWEGGSGSRSRSSSNSSCNSGKSTAAQIGAQGWVLGVHLGRFRLFKKDEPSDETLGTTPRTLEVGGFDLYYDADGTSIRNCSSRGSRSGTSKSDPSASDVGLAPIPVPPLGSTAAVRDSEDGGDEGVLPKMPLLGEREAYHNSMLKVESIRGTFLFPDLMGVLCGLGRQPGGKGKLLGIHFEQMEGVVVQLEPFQVFGLLTHAVPLLSMIGPYTEWYAATCLDWNKKAFAHSRVPSGEEELARYAKALGPPAATGGPSGGGDEGGGTSKKKKGKRDAALLAKLDKGMSLAQIMLTRMRVRRWEVARPEGVMTWARWLLDFIDPFQGILPDELAEDLPAADGDGRVLGDQVVELGGDRGGDKSEADEEVPTVSAAGRSEGVFDGVLRPLQTEGPEEEARLESILYFVAQESTYAGAESPILMEIDVSMRAENVALLIYHPHVKRGKDKGPRSRDNFAGDSLSDEEDFNDLPDGMSLRRQHSGGSVIIGDGEGELSTHDAIDRRDALRLPPLAAVITIEDFGFGFNMLMGSEASDEAVTTPAATATAEGETEGGLTAGHVGNDQDRPFSTGGTAANESAAGAGGDEQETMPVALHTFSDTLFPNALPIRLEQPARIAQGADLRLENFGSREVGDGVASMGISLNLGGTSITDFGGLEEGGVLPTVLGGSSVVSARGASGPVRDSDKAGGTTMATLAFYSGGRLEVGLDFTDASVVALPARIMAIIDVVLACVMGPPAARQAMELDALEDEVAEEEEEEATGRSGTEVLAPSARWEVLDRVRSAYLYFGRMDARFTIRVNNFALLLPQNAQDVRTNILMAQCSALTLDMQSGSASERLDMEVGSFSVAPCVQGRKAPESAIVTCRRLHEAAVTVALRGPLPDMLGVMRAGFPLKDLDLFPIVERQIIHPVNMCLRYSTEVSFRVTAPEAEVQTLVGDMIRFNSPLPSNYDSDTSGCVSDATAARANEELAIAALSDVGEEGDSPAARLEEGPTGSGPVATTTADGVSDAVASEDGEGCADEEDAEGGKGAEALLAGLYVQSEVRLHVMSGLRIKVTDLDLAVLQAIATSLLASFGGGAPAAADANAAVPTGKSGGTAGKSLTFALDKAQRRMVASLRQAFRRADVNGDGTLDRAEVENLLRHHLEAQNLDPAQKEAEVEQFISLLDEDGTATLDIDEFTSTMLKLMTHGPDEATLRRARRHALTNAFREADADLSGTLDVDEITELLKKSDPVRTQSELERQVNRFVSQADADGDGQVDLEEFIELVRCLQSGNPHEGPLAPLAKEFRSWEVINGMLEGFDNLPALLAAREADYSPPKFWEQFERETHAKMDGPSGQKIEAVQAKMVKTFDNYSFARDAWSLLVAPAWYPGVVRIGALSLVKGDGGKQSSSSPAPQQIPAPVRPGALVYAQQRQRRFRSAPPSYLAGMRIQRLPEELAPPHRAAIDPSLSAAAGKNDSEYVTGVRLPAPAGRRRMSLRMGSSERASLQMAIDRPCMLLVCFHDTAALTNRSGASQVFAAGAGAGGREVPRQPRPKELTLKLPAWAIEMGLTKTHMKIEATLPGEDGASSTRHVYRIFSAHVEAGPLLLGPVPDGSLPYLVLLYGGNLGKLTSRKKHAHANVRRPLRAVSDGNNRRRFPSMLRRDAKLILRGGGSTTISGTRGTSAPVMAARREESTESDAAGSTHGSTAGGGDAGSGGVLVPVAIDSNPSWQLSPAYSLSAAGHGLATIAETADIAAGKAASTALRIAAISSAAGGRNTEGASFGLGRGSGGAVADAAKQPRIRFKVALLCEHGILLQMDDLHRLENTASDQRVDPTFELAFKVPEQANDARSSRSRSSGGADGVSIVEAVCPVDGCGPSPPISSEELDKENSGSGTSGTRASVDVGLMATLDFEHVASSEILGEDDSLKMEAAFGVEGRYFNPRVQRGEHFIEPWSMRINMSDPRGAATLRGEMTAKRHFVLNATTGLTSLACSIFDTQNYANTRYSTTSVYTELRYGTGEGDDGSRLLTIENHLGVPVTVSLEHTDGAGEDALETSSSRGLHFGRKLKISPPRSSGRTTSTSTKLAASLYAKKGKAMANPQGTRAGMAGTPADRISLGELLVPDAKKSLQTATVTVEVKGFQPLSGVPLDLLGRGTHVFKMTRYEAQSQSTQTKQWRFEGLVVKFVARPARDPSVLDLAMQLQTNVFLKNDTPRPLRVALSRERDHEPNTMIPVDGEVCLPFPLLSEKVLRLWRSPSTMVGGAALKEALEGEKEAEKARMGTGAVGRGRQNSSEEWSPGVEVEDVGQEVSVAVGSKTFDRKAKVAQRHSESMLMNGISVERTDLAPTPGLIMHGAGDKSPALWRMYVRAPYVVQNGLACDIVVWASQAPAGSTNEAALASPKRFGISPRSGHIRRLTLGSIGRSHRKDASRASAPLPAAPASSTTPGKPSSSRFKKNWGARSATTGVRGTRFPGSGGSLVEDTSDESTNIPDSGSDDDEDDDTDTETEEEEEGEGGEGGVEHLSPIDASARAPTAVAAHRHGGTGGKVLWVLKSGEEAKLEGMDMTRPLKLRVGFAPVDGGSTVSDWCQPYVIEAECHTDRTALNNLPSKESRFSRGARGPGGARRPDFKFGTVWENTPGNRHIHIYTKVWVLNKTGVSLAYRAASYPTKDDGSGEAVSVRRPTKCCYRTDGDTMLFSRYVAGSKTTQKKLRGGGACGGGGGGDLPLMLNCPANKLQTMPYAVNAGAVDSPLYLSEARSSVQRQTLPCMPVDGADDDASGTASWPIYSDNPAARVRLPREVVPVGVRRVHLLTLYSDAKTGQSFKDTLTGGVPPHLVTFTASRDCRVYVGIDKRLLAPDPGPPKWLSLQGFERCTHGDAAEDVHASPTDLAPQGFALFSRFCRGLSVVSLGRNVDHDGDAAECKDGGVAAMYFVVVVRVAEEEATKEVDVGPVVMHRSMSKYFEFRNHHRWRLKPHFQPGDPCYNDRDGSYTVTAIPEALNGVNLMQIVTAQGDKRVKANNMASFQVLQNSRVLVCFDTRAAENPPLWLGKRGFQRQEDMVLPAAPEGGNYGYVVFGKFFHEGAEVKLGGNRTSSARRMYFCLVHAAGDQSGRISAPPALLPPAPCKSAASSAATEESGRGGVAPLEGSDLPPYSGADESAKGGRKSGAIVAAEENEGFYFWDDEANGKLVQAPLDLDRQGRGWCEAFATDAVKTTGQATSPAGVFGVTIEALSGAFLKTRVVTVWPRFVVRNDLGREVGVLPTKEPPPKSGSDLGQSGRRLTKEEREDHRAIGRAARSMAQAVPNSASVIIYDFADLEDYDDEEYLGAESSSGNSRRSFRRPGMFKSKRASKEEKLPCVRLLSPEVENESDANGGAGGEQWMALPTVAVMLESMGKDTYVWLDAGGKKEDVLVRVSCRMLSNGATVHVVLSDETPCPPLRIENRSSTQTLAYRLGGDAEGNLRMLEPMRWNALHWIDDDLRYIEAAVYTGERKGFTSQAFRRRKRRLKDAALKRGKAMKSFTARPLLSPSPDSSRVEGHPEADASPSEDGGSESESEEEGKSGKEQGRRPGFSSFRWASRSIVGFDSHKKYETEEVGRLKDLVAENPKGKGELRLQAECLRPSSSVATTVLAFSDTSEGVYGRAPLSDVLMNGIHKDEDGHDTDSDDHKVDEDEVGEVMSMFARLWTGIHFEARFEGMVLNIIDSTASGPSELAAFSVDGVELGKPSGTARVLLTVWHFQLDDMRADSPHPIILTPLESGFNSHLTKVHDNGLKAGPAVRVEVERDIKVSLMHHMSVIRSIVVVLGKIRCAVHVDFWIDVQDAVFASLNWNDDSPEAARARAMEGAQLVVGKNLEAPASDATMDRIYIGAYHQAGLEVDVDFHLGTKVLALLSAKPPADGDEEEDQGGFGASLAMMPLGAVGGVAWGVLSSFGVGVANASPEFSFDAYEREHYYGSKSQAVRLIVMSFVKQGVIQAYKVLGHIDILGDPLSLGKSLSSGVIGFVTKTGAGQFGEGSKDLVKGVVGGAASSASKITDALDHVVREAGALDSSTPTAGSSGMSEKAPEHLGQGVTQGIKYFGHSVKAGVTGVVMKPIRGAQNKGAIGFVQGMGQGVVGFVAAPISGALGATSKIAASIDATTRLLDDEPMGRRREPRHPIGAGERDDREREKKERKKSRKKIKRSSYEDADELEPVNSDEESDSDDPGNDVAPRIAKKGAPQNAIDIHAEAGGVGLLLVPLTPEDMRTNYSKDYLEKCGGDADSTAGALAMAEEEEKKISQEERARRGNDGKGEDGSGRGEGGEKGKGGGGEGSLRAGAGAAERVSWSKGSDGEKKGDNSS